MASILTSEQAAQLARNVVARRFTDAHVAFCAGSLMVGEGTPHSDIDLVVIFASLEHARRESFIYDSVPIEAFLHDPATLRYFFENVNAASGIPSLPRMVDEGVIVCGTASEAEQYKQWATEILAAGPLPLTSEQIQDTAYAISDMVDDLREPRSCKQLILGSGQMGNLHLSPEAEAFFAKKGCKVVLRPTPEAIRVFNKSRGRKAGLFHVTC